MKPRFILYFMLPCIPITATPDTLHAQPVREFFLSLRQAVDGRDTTVLMQLVYPFKDEVEDMQAGLIENMLSGDPLLRGDGAFSMYALDTLIAHHLDEIKPVDDTLYAQLSTDRFFGNVVSTYGQKHVWVMDFHEARMILLEKNGMFQLLFWEDLNRLLNPALRATAH